MILLLLVLSLILANDVTIGFQDFWEQRKAIIEKEDQIAIGSQLELTEQEKCVSDILNDIKLKEWNIGYNNPKQFHPSRHFFETNSFIEQSSVFYFLKNLPKGALLHTHFYGMVSSEFIYNLTYSEDLYACYHEEKMLLHFFYDHVDNRCDWLPVRYLRKADKMFDKKFKSSAFMPNIAESKPFDDNTDAENAFTQAKEVLFGLISYKPIFYKYFYRGLEELYEDRIMYVELRSTVLPVYDLEGNEYQSYEVIQMMKEIVAEFQCSHPSFLGAKLIYTGRKIVTDEKDDIEESVQRVLAIAKYFPDFVVGYDVMRREELKDVLVKILDIVRSQPDLKFFFHAGATNWFGGQTDMNVLDAILMKTYRIGHGLSLLKHPELLRIVKERNIPIEVCPISNQVFNVITDLRNHPATHFISHGYPVVIGNDDPGLWNAKGVTYDWYMVFMGMAKVDRDLRLLKQLAINSILYSGMDDKEKGLVAFAKMWNSFIESVPRCSRNSESPGEYPDESFDNPVGGINIRPDHSGFVSSEINQSGNNGANDHDSMEDTYSDIFGSLHTREISRSESSASGSSEDSWSPSDVSQPDLPEIIEDRSADVATIGPVHEVTEYHRDQESGDRGVGSGDRGVNSGDRGVNSGDRAVDSGDRGVDIGDRELGSGDRGIASGDRGIASGDRGVAANEETLGGSGANAADSRQIDGQGTPIAAGGAVGTTVAMATGLDGQGGTGPTPAPGDGAAAPADGVAPPAEGEAAPGEGEAAPTAGEAPPAEGEAPPAEGEAVPAEGDAAPADGEAAPAEGEAPPADGEAPPAEGEAAPAEGDAPPAEEAPAAEVPAK